jgi:glycerol-3-phosphate dehydrogenase
MVDRAMAMLGKRVRRSPTATKPLPWSPVTTGVGVVPDRSRRRASRISERSQGPASQTPAAADFTAWKLERIARGKELGLSDEAAVLCTRYGTNVDAIHELIRANPGLAHPIHPDLAFTNAEIVWAATHTMTVTIDDILRRRMPLAILAAMPRGVMQRALELTASLRRTRT